MPCKVVAIIQARMASSRLPGKVLLDIVGEPMLERVVKRTSRAERVDAVVVATTIDASDDPVAAFCEARGIAFMRGSQFDVLERYYQAARAASADIVVRVTGDCPAIDPGLIDEVIGLLLDDASGTKCEPRFDFAANRLPPPFSRTFPIGLDVEVCAIAALERAWKDGHERVHREHVMPFLYEGVTLRSVTPTLATGATPRGFRVGLLNHVPDLGHYRWTVDTPEDLEFMRQVYARLDGRDDFTWDELLRLVQREPELHAINSAVRHKTLGEVDERAAKH